MNTTISRPDITQSYNFRADNIQRTSKEGKLDDSDRYMSNVAGVIGGIVAGAFAFIGGFFLLAVFGGEFLSFGATLGGSLLIGAGGAVGGFFLFKYAIQALIKSGGNSGGHFVGDHHTVKPVNTHSTTQSTSLSSYKMQFEEFALKFTNTQKLIQSSILKDLQLVDNQVNGYLEQNKISQEMADSLLGACKATSVYTGLEMKKLGDCLIEHLKQFGQVMSLPVITKKDYFELHNGISKVLLEEILALKESFKTKLEEMKGGGEKLKEKYQNENCSAVVDAMVGKLSANLDKVVNFYEAGIHNLLKISEDFLNCL